MYHLLSGRSQKRKFLYKRLDPSHQRHICRGWFYGSIDEETTSFFLGFKPNFQVRESNFWLWFGCKIGWRPSSSYQNLVPFGWKNRIYADGKSPFQWSAGKFCPTFRQFAPLFLAFHTHFLAIFSSLHATPNIFSLSSISHQIFTGIKLTTGRSAVDASVAPFCLAV